MIHLLDGNAISTTAFYAVHTDPKEPFSATKYCTAFMGSLAKNLLLASTTDAPKVVFCVDSPSWRKLHYKGYKHKERTPESLQRHFQYLACYGDIIADMKGSLPIHVVQRTGMEADDLIAYYTYARGAEPVRIYTADKDMRQLYNPNGVEYYSIKDDALQTFDPLYELHYLLCHGDSNDAIPGINRNPDNTIGFRFGEKTIQSTYSPNSVNEMNIDELFLIKLSTAAANMKHSEFVAMLKERYDRNRLLIDFTKAPWYVNQLKLPSTVKGSAVQAGDFWQHWYGSYSDKLAYAMTMFDTHKAPLG